MSFNTKYCMHKQMNKSKPDEKAAIKFLRKKIPYFKSIEERGLKTDKADSFLTRKDEWAEIKVDYTEYPNHFIERYSQLDAKVDGGPWQYLKRGVKWYIFYYKKTNEIYVFKTKDLIKEVEKLFKNDTLNEKKQGREVFQVHKRYVTFGYIIPKTLLDSVVVFKFSFDSLK